MEIGNEWCRGTTKETVMAVRVEDELDKLIGGGMFKVFFSDAVEEKIALNIQKAEEWWLGLYERSQVTSLSDLKRL